MKRWHVLPCHRWFIISRALLTQRPFPPRPILALVVVLFIHLGPSSGQRAGYRPADALYVRRHRTGWRVFSFLLLEIPQEIRCLATPPQRWRCLRRDALVDFAATRRLFVQAFL
jgi:hypothetical protein